MVLGPEKDDTLKKPLDVQGSGQSMGVLLPKGSPNTAVVSEIIEQMKQDGTIDELSSKYLSVAYGVDPTEIPLWSIE